LLDWRIITAVIVIGAVAGIVSLYLMGCFLRWSGRLFGGRASMAAVRAALAWGGAPFAVGGLICLVIFLALAHSSQANASALRVAFFAVVSVLGLWSCLAILFMFARVQNFGFWRTIFSFAIATFVLLPIIPLLIRTFLFQAFSIPSGAMMPTLLVGDYVFVSKYSYGYTHYSLPLSPDLFSGRIFASAPQLGDVVVFRLPKDDSIDYIKRIVGLPGDRVQMIDGVLQINGQPVKHEQIADFVTEEGGKIQHIKRYRETLPNGVSYTTIVLTGTGFLDNTPVFTVPAGRYFVIGDNLDNSTDSRVLSQVGYVPFENLIGRAERIYLSIDRDSGTGQPTIRMDRIGMAIR
jgi:signal peptidase I